MHFPFFFKGGGESFGTRYSIIINSYINCLTFFCILHNLFLWAVIYFDAIMPLLLYHSKSLNWNLTSALIKVDPINHSNPFFLPSVPFPAGLHINRHNRAKIATASRQGAERPRQSGVQIFMFRCPRQFRRLSVCKLMDSGLSALFNYTPSPPSEVRRNICLPTRLPGFSYFPGSGEPLGKENKSDGN